MDNKELNPYEAKPWIEKGAGWYKNSEYLVGYQIFYKGVLFYNCRGYKQEETQKMTDYMNLAYVQGMSDMRKKMEQKEKPVNVAYGAE